MGNPLELISTFLSITSLHSNLKALSIYVRYWTSSPSTDIVGSIANECGFALRNVETLESILVNSLEGLLTLDLELYLRWSVELWA